MAIKFLSGSSLDGNTVTITGTEYGVTVGPETRANWGGPLSGAEITGLTITKKEYATNFAPHLVEFEADYSLCNFETPHPATEDDYDERFHDLDIFWTFDDIGTFDYLDRVPASYKDKNAAKGQYVTHCYTADGTYTVTCLVYERSTGLFAQATVDVTVNAQDAQFPTTDTICIYPTGGTAGTVPTGAVTVEADSLLDGDTHFTSNQGGNKRFLFQRGGSYDVKVNFDQADFDGVMVGAYGAGADPILTINLNGTDTTPTMIGARFLQFFKCENIEARGLYNPTIASNLYLDKRDFAGNFISCSDSRQTVICNSDLKGFAAGTFGVSVVNDLTFAVKAMFYNLSVTEFGGQYNAFFQPAQNLESSISLIGIKATQKEDAVTDQSFKSWLRHNNTNRLHMRGLEVFIRDKEAAALKLFNGNGQDKRTQKATVQNMVIESFAGQIAVGTNELNAQRINIRFSDIITIGQYNTPFGILATQLTGVTLENALHCTPNLGRTNLNSRSAVRLEFNNLTADSAAGPIKLRNITYGMFRTVAINGGEPEFLSTLNVNGTFPVTVVEENNIIHLPEYSTTPFAPLDETTVLLQSRNTYGFISPFGFVEGTFASNVAPAATYDITVADTSIYQDWLGEPQDIEVNGSSVISAEVTYSIINGTTIRVTNNTATQWSSGETYSFGLIWAASIVHSVDTVTATPTDAVKTLKPLTGSPALAGATGFLPRRSVATNALRPEGSEDIGAWQVST